MSRQPNKDIRSSESTFTKGGQTDEEILFTCLWALLNLYMKISRKGAEAQRYEEEFILYLVMPVDLCLSVYKY